MNSISTAERQLLFDFITSSTSISNDLFAQIIQLFKKKTFKKGDFILKEGDIETFSNIVVEGVVHQYTYEEDQPITINITPKGFSFNNLKSYITKTPSLEVHEAITDVELMCITRKDIDALMRKSHEFSYLMFKIYENILLDRENRMFLLQFKNPTKRYRLFHEIVERANKILDDAPDKYIASYLNMTPQQYSNEKKKMLKGQL